MFAVSTGWTSAGARSGEEVLGPIRQAGIEAIELEYRITEHMYEEMLPSLKRGDPAVLSIHNFFPLPPVLGSGHASGDAFLLSSPEKEERERAVKYTLRTIEHAHEVGARGVVLHLGKIDMDNGFSRLKEAHEKGALEEPSNRDYVHSLLRERAKMSKQYLEAALFSLDKLWRPAERLAVKLGIENRYYLNEVPTPEELSVILDKFEGSNIGYWHDVGHAAVQDLMYGIGHERMLADFSPRMMGVHLHDADGVNDHQAPGKGNVDFRMVRAYVPDGAIRVIELSPGVSSEDLSESIEFLTSEEVLRL